MTKGQALLEMGKYEKAVEALSEAVKKDPNNKKAYFYRAAAYYETGRFDEAIKDYLMSDKGKKISKSDFVASKEFTEALVKSSCQAASTAAVDYVPSLCHSTYGLSETLWAVHWSANPLNSQAPENIKNFANACYEMAECVVDYCKNVDSETIDGYVDHVKTLYQKYDQLTDTEKGEYVGYIIGTYGVEILAGAATVKGMQVVSKGIGTYRNLRNANQICNMEAMLISEVEKKAVIASSLEHAAERERYFKNIQIHWDRQNKHIPGKHNFEPDRGIIRLTPSELEAKIKQHVGTGDRVIGSILEAEYKERVDFGEIIGEFALKVDGKPIEYLPTTKAIFVYDKKGRVHLWPAHPEAKFE